MQYDLRAISITRDLPMIFLRKEPKEYGTKKLIEVGNYLKGEKVVLIEDVVTTGNNNLKVSEVLYTNVWDIRNIFIN